MHIQYILREKVAQKCGIILLKVPKIAESKQPPIGRKFAQSDQHGQEPGS
jgi:hypothetical protein